MSRPHRPKDGFDDGGWWVHLEALRVKISSESAPGRSQDLRALASSLRWRRTGKWSLIRQRADDERKCCGWYVPDCSRSLRLHLAQCEYQISQTAAKLDCVAAGLSRCGACHAMAGDQQGTHAGCHRADGEQDRKLRAEEPSRG